MPGIRKGIGFGVKPVRGSLTDTLSGYSDESLRMLQKSALDEGKADEAAAYGREIEARIDTPLTAVHNTTAEGIRAADQLGGIPAPSHAVVRPEQDFSGFGDISLVAPKGMVDPEMGQPLFGSDVYSRRQPKPLYRASKSITSQEANAVRNAMEEFGDSHRWEFSDWLERGDPREFRASGSDGFMAAYARANGVDVPGPKSPLATADRQRLESEIRDLKRAYDDEFSRLSDADPDFDPVKASESDSLNAIGERLSEARARLDDSRGPSAYEIRKLLEDSGVDPYGAEKWLTESLISSGDWGKPYFERGRKKVDYTVDNLAEYMNARVRGEEQTMVEGLGKQRSGSAKKFRSIDQAKRSSDSIVGSDEFKAFAESTNEDLFAIADRVESPYSSHFNKIDDVSRAVGDVMKGMSPAAALRKHELSGDVEDELLALADRVKNGPTEYFESKYQGVAKLGDYAGAIVPENTPDDVVRLLQAQGLQVERYADEAGRTAARKRIPGSAFVLPLVAGTIAAAQSQNAEAAPMGTLRVGGATVGYATSEFAAAESSVNATEDDFKASAERFKALRKGKRAERVSAELERVLAPVAGPVKQLMDAAEVMLVSVAGGIPGYLAELTGYVRGEDLDAARAGGGALAAEVTGTLAQALGTDWDAQNPYLQGMAAAMEQGEKEFADAYQKLGVDNSVMKKGWDALPERAQRIIAGMADLAL